MENSSDRLARATTESLAAAMSAAARARSDVGRAARAGARGRAAAQPVEGSGGAVAGTTYLLGVAERGGDPASIGQLRVGARLSLRRGSQIAPPEGGWPSRVEARAPDGRLVGQLPPDDAAAVAELLDAGVRATARVSALVPAFRRQRVQLAIEIERMAGDAGIAETGRGARGRA